MEATFTPGLTSILVWISNFISHEIWDEINHPFSNFNGAAVAVWEWISNFMPHFTGSMTAY